VEVSGDAKTAEAIEAKIENWKQLISEKEAELAEITEKLEGMSPADLLGDEAKGLKDGVQVRRQGQGRSEQVAY